MQLKTFAISVLAAAIVAGCATQQPAEEKVAAAPAVKKAPPKVIAGASGALLASTCEGCHGTDGNSNGPATPSIAGMSEDYLVEAMEEFRDGDTRSTIMGRIAKGYTDEEIGLMAGHYAGLTFEKAGQKAHHRTIAKGEDLHNTYCEKCHNDAGSDPSDDSGILSGQWVPYLKYTMADFRSGERDISRKMKKKLDQLLASEGESGLDAVISYYGSQK